MSASDDARWLAAAACLAERARPLSRPNPAVGAILVKDGIVVGRGWTPAGGRPHAEAMALVQAGADGARRDALRHARALRPPSERGPGLRRLAGRGGHRARGGRRRRSRPAHRRRGDRAARARRASPPISPMTRACRASLAGYLAAAHARPAARHAQARA